ncbi:MAG: hypothetical protein OEU92_23255 [Alphaproteobacteria bacterium]|nr:hypothetical protein [Alphaproteobacteria bacterium]
MFDAPTATDILDGDGTPAALFTMSGPVAAGLGIVTLLRRAYPLDGAFCGTQRAVALRAGQGG